MDTLHKGDNDGDDDENNNNNNKYQEEKACGKKHPYLITTTIIIIPNIIKICLQSKKSDLYLLFYVKCYTIYNLYSVHYNPVSVILTKHCTQFSLNSQ
jgi:hypothetical protein